ncbi:MFS transporter [Arcanobacterium buesumense]|uniref:MFS transporter n=1 Tax=Arcanobacterium buesumense TaxID=2722751 RepID=A0A6H2EN31_9ACTO|nr:MFS transporter [Arcanobacterium buesumense]QJC22483.1 MFS transporter [Arcanobacterium buesumense]
MKLETTSLPSNDAFPYSPEDSSLETAPKKTNLFTKKIIYWGLWDWGSAAFNAIVTTFIFAFYISNPDLFGDHANTYLGWALGIAGVIIALIAPALGQAVDRSGKRATVLSVTTLGTATIIGLLFFVKPGEDYLLLGLVLVGIGNILFETGGVVYNSLLSDLAPKEHYGRISGFGWGLGYLGGIVLLLILFIGFINPEVGWFGVTSSNGLNVRVSMLVAAAWLAGFSLPLIFTLKNKERATESTVDGFFNAYRELFKSIRQLWRNDRIILWFLISSAIYRDGLAGVFSFGAIIAGVAFGFSNSEVILFGIAANVVAGIFTIGFGWLDDRIGAAKVIIFSVASMVLLGLGVFIFHDGLLGYSGHEIYWIFGLALCVFVGPTQSASRTYLARLAPAGEEAEIFGLYATTGRAASPLAPFLYATAISAGAWLLDISRHDAAYFGILGVVFVLFCGLVSFIPVARHAKRLRKAAKASKTSR